LLAARSIPRRVATGDTVFLRFVDNLDLRFDYRFESPVADEVAGTAALEATVRGGNGWAVDVESFVSLAQLAGRYDRLILHETYADGDSYLV